MRTLPFAGGGEIGLFADPDGNVLGLWQRKGGRGRGRNDGAQACREASRPSARQGGQAGGQTARGEEAPQKETKK